MLKQLPLFLAIAILSVLFVGCGQNSATVEQFTLPELSPLPKATVEAPAETPSPTFYEAAYKETDLYDDSTKRPPMVALTFDDGPSRYTDSILDLLEYYGGRATFFVVAPRVLAQPETIIRAHEMGHEIANHSWTHRNLSTLTKAEITEEIQSTSEVITNKIGASPPMHRPPFGMTDDRVIQISYELGYSIIKWTVDPLDWRYRDADIVYQHILDHAEDGAIILTHDTRPTTAAAMERVIPRLIEEGFQLVTVSELLYHLYGGLEAGRIYGSYSIID